MRDNRDIIEIQRNKIFELEAQIRFCNEVIKTQKKNVNKGRTIAAMLFWNYKETKRLLQGSPMMGATSIIAQSKFCFKQAMKILGREIK